MAKKRPTKRAAPAEGPTPKASLSQFCSVTEAAEITGVSDRQVRNALEDGRIVGEKVGFAWMVLRSSAESFQRQRAPKATKAGPKRKPRPGQ